MRALVTGASRGIGAAIAHALADNGHQVAVHYRSGSSEAAQVVTGLAGSGHVSVQGDFDVLWKEFLRAGRPRGQYAVRHRDGSIVEVAYCSQTNVLPDRHVIVLRRLG